MSIYSFFTANYSFVIFYVGIEVGAAQSVTLQPKPQQLLCVPGHHLFDELPALKNFTFKGDWLEGDDFEDAYLSERTRLQIRTIRYQKGASRCAPFAQ